MVLFLSLIFCKQEEKLLFFGSVSGCTCLILYFIFVTEILSRTVLVKRGDDFNHHLNITQYYIWCGFRTISLAKPVTRYT